MHFVREAGGAFGKRQATKEEEYFRKMVSQNDHPVYLMLWCTCIKIVGRSYYIVIYTRSMLACCQDI